MKQDYISPQTKLIRMDGYLAPICISGEKYSKENGVFDPDSDA